MDHFAAFAEPWQSSAAERPRCRSGWPSGLQVDLRVVPAESFGAALQYFTGSKEHNIVLRGRAKDRGLKINEYGVFRVDGKDENSIAGRTEEESTPRSICPAFRPSCAKPGASSSGPRPASCRS